VRASNCAVRGEGLQKNESPGKEPGCKTGTGHRLRSISRIAPSAALSRHARMTQKSESPGDHPGLILDAVCRLDLSASGCYVKRIYLRRVTGGGRGTRTLVADEATRPFYRRRPLPTATPSKHRLLNGLYGSRESWLRRSKIIVGRGSESGMDSRSLDCICLAQARNKFRSG